LAHQDEDTIDPLNLNQWDFYILDTDVLNNEVGEQKTIALSSLRHLAPIKSTYQEIKENIKKIGQQKVLPR